MKVRITLAVMDLDLRRLRYFVTVAEELSFVRAASLLHMTQPALSRQISALEHDLGTQLLERDRRGTSLQPAKGQLAQSFRCWRRSSARPACQISSASDCHQ